MVTLYNQSGIDAVLQRVDKLSEANTAQWGKMNVGQMVAHICLPLEVAIGRHQLPSMFFMKLFGPMIRKSILSDKPVKKNSPTAPSFVMTGTHNLAEEKARLSEVLNLFSRQGAQNQLPDRHPLFGKMTHADWDMMQYKHLDHHLTQFGV